MRSSLFVRSAPALLALGLAVAAAVAPVQATVLPRFEAGDLADSAALVFVGTVVDQQVVVTGDGLYPYTFVTFDVEETLKGQADEQLTLRFDGGPIGNEIIEVIGMPKFAIGGRHLLFVSGIEGDLCPLVGWDQGKFDFVRHPQGDGEVLVDSHQRPVTGVKGDRLVRHSQKLTGAPAGRQVKLLREENVKITFAGDEAVATAQELAAERSMAEIRRWLGSRKAKGRAVAASRVRSAQPGDVPHTAPINDGGVR